MADNLRNKWFQILDRYIPNELANLKPAARNILVALLAITATQASWPSMAANEVPADTGKTLDSAPSTAAQDDYRLDMGDHLRIRFYDRYDRDDLNGEYIINESGQLRLPRVDVFDARNKSAAELERDIRQAVESKGEKLGFFTIDVILHRPFYVAGLVNHPGSYAFLPGLTVAHAVSLAGGLYRSPLTSVADAMREKRTLTETMSRVAELLGRRARLEAERDGGQTIAVPKELAKLDPLRAAKIIANERTILDRSLQLFDREKSGLEVLVALKRSEAGSYEREIVRLGQRIEEQAKIFFQLKKLHEEKVINQQRFFEAVVALDGLQRDKQIADTGLSQTNTTLEKAQRDLALLKLADNARIAKEMTDTEQELARLKLVAAQTRELVTGLDALVSQSNSGLVATYRITRKDKDGQANIVQASETTPIMPGDVIKIDIHMEAGPNWLD